MPLFLMLSIVGSAVGIKYTLAIGHHFRTAHPGRSLCQPLLHDMQSAFRQKLTMRQFKPVAASSAGWFWEQERRFQADYDYSDYNYG